MIIPVLDLKDGKAVSGKSGARETYKPLKTIFHESSSPCKIAKALSDRGASRIYVADLDSIEGTGSNFHIIKDINEHHVSVTLDCGVGNINDVRNALKVADKVIVATETLHNIEALSLIFDSFSKDRLVISVDIKNGKLFSKHLKINVEDLIKKIKELNPQEIILLDISKVGLERGVNLELIKKFQGMEKSLIIGGGIREHDIIQLEKIGINKFLVGTALHNGNLKVKF
ncbi:MAG: HisA/HisF family protein [Methanobacterium sp.]